jgi:hypothetical protein
MTDAGFNLVRYADDFVVMCATDEEARAAYSLSKRILEKRLHLRLHAVGEQNSKTRILRFEKGLKFLGVLFKGGRVAPSETVVNKFKARVQSILDTRQPKSLLETLTTLKNTINGWGQCYCDFDVAQLYTDLDAGVRKEITTYMHQHDFLLQRHTISRKQIRLLGVPELSRFLQNSFRSRVA